MVATYRFIGRADELRRLERWLDEAAGGEPRLALIGAAAGVGKTRLIDRFITATADSTDACVVRGACHEGARVPFLPVLSALRVLPTWAAPEWGTDDDGAALGLYLAASDALLASAAARTTVLVIDDLHWADAGTLDVLVHLITAVVASTDPNARRLLFVLSHRPLTIDEPAGRFAARARRETWYRSIDLQGFDSLGVSALVTALTGQRPSKQLVQALAESSDGNPLMVQSLLARLSSFGRLATRGAHLVLRGDDALLPAPGELDLLLRDRLGGIDDAGRTLLTTAAFLGDGGSLVDLQEVSGLGDDRFADLLDEMEQTGILLTGDERYHFEHPQLRQLVYQEPRGRRRQQLHRSVAQKLMATPDADERAMVIADHLRQAGALSPAPELLRWSVGAGNLAAGIGAWADAARDYAAAVEAALAVHGSDRPGALVAHLHNRAAVACWFNHDNEPARVHAEAATALGRQLGDLRLWGTALVALMRASIAGAASPLAIVADTAAIEEFFEVAEEDEPELRAQVHEHLSAVYFHHFDLAAGRRHADAARALARDLGDVQLMATVEFGAGLQHLAAVELDDALACFERATRARDTGAAPRRSAAASRAALTQWCAGRLDEARRWVDDVIAEAPKGGAFAQLALAAACGIGVAAAQGREEDSEALGALALEVNRWAEFGAASAIALPQLASARSLRGDRDGAIAALEDLAAEGGRVGLLRLLVLARAGDVDGARASLDLHRARTPTADPPQLFDAAAVAMRVELGDALSQPDLVRHGAAAVRDLAARGLCFEPSCGFFLPRLAGVAALVVGALDEAEALLAHAALLAERAPLAAHR